jgi:WD40 repeat protein
MATANFTYEGIKTAIQCLKEDKMKDVCKKYTSKIEKDINSLYFIYNGNKINYDLSFFEQANSLDKQRLEMNVLVYNNNDSNVLNNNNNNNELRQYNNIKNNNDNLYNNFDIKLRNLINILKVHKGAINCSIVLNDGRFATCSNDNSIIIYNNKTFKPDLIIKEHTDSVIYILQLSSGMLASCSGDQTIKIFNINNNNYEVFQTLQYHQDSVYKIIELNNKKLVSCSGDCSIIVYSIDNNKYKKDYHIKTNGFCFCVIQTKVNEICYYGDKSICFYDLLKKIIIKKINDINDDCCGCNFLNLLTKDLLLSTGIDKLYIINVNEHNITRIINAPGSNYIMVSCILNNNTLLTGDYNRNIKQWKIEGDNLNLISTKENAHDSSIISLIKLEDGYILSGSDDGEIKIW